MISVKNLGELRLYAMRMRVLLPVSQRDARQWYTETSVPEWCTALPLHQARDENPAVRGHRQTSHRVEGQVQVGVSIERKLLYPRFSRWLGH